MSWVTQQYETAASDLDDHLGHCRDCRSGGPGCADGDDAAEAEYRAYMDLRHYEPEQAKTWGRGGAK
jgi:hypothetical protein